MTDVQSTKMQADHAEKNRELISALADGQLLGESFNEACESAALHQDGRETWMTYHLIGDALRSQELTQTVCSAAFMSKLSARLSETSIDSPLDIEVAQTTVAYSVETVEAANDSVFRWKMVAGVATLATVAVLAWSSISTTTQQPQLALAPEANKLAVAEATPEVRAAAQQTANGVMIRDPRLDELLAAHRQVGGASALQMPSGFLRNATFDGPNR